ncbi:MAG: hypothetical protein IPP68_00225 [Elusimicrobia bacterium]|nr:hypothetical protein [Elusimicrobiota bacterium]
MTQKFWGKFFYWTLCTILVFALFIIFFGIVPLFFLNSNAHDFVKIFSTFFAFIGLFIMVLAVHKPGLAWKTFLRKQTKPAAEISGRGTQLFALGISLVIGSLLYAYTGDASAVAGLFFIFVVVRPFLS